MKIKTLIQTANPDADTLSQRSVACWSAPHGAPVTSDSVLEAREADGVVIEQDDEDTWVCGAKGVVRGLLRKARLG